ncbi:flavodoxin [Candidatus Parcubacteria bacterium]|nr:MAG: flavodoxin [Candidatus Parcubacteria bacterium]
MKSIVVYYSLTENTKFLAKEIAKFVNADLLELKPEKEISKGLTKYLWGGKQVFMKEKPKLNKIDKKIENYDQIFIGTPVWAWTFTPPIRTFLSENKIAGKKVYLFASHEGGLGKTLEDLKKQLENNKQISKIDFYKPLENIEKCKKQIAEWLEIKS